MYAKYIKSISLVFLMILLSSCNNGTNDQIENSSSTKLTLLQNNSESFHSNLGGSPVDSGQMYALGEYITAIIDPENNNKLLITQNGRSRPTLVLSAPNHGAFTSVIYNGGYPSHAHHQQFTFLSGNSIWIINCILSATDAPELLDQKSMYIEGDIELIQIAPGFVGADDSTVHVIARTPGNKFIILTAHLDQQPSENAEIVMKGGIIIQNVNSFSVIPATGAQIGPTFEIIGQFLDGGVIKVGSITVTLNPRTGKAVMNGGNLDVLPPSYSSIFPSGSNIFPTGLTPPHPVLGGGCASGGAAVAAAMPVVAPIPQTSGESTIIAIESANCAWYPQIIPVSGIRGMSSNESGTNMLVDVDGNILIQNVYDRNPDWKSLSTIKNISITQLAYDGNNWVAYGFDSLESFQQLVSQDGIVWTNTNIPPFMKISIGSSSTCGITNENYGNVGYCWGSGDSGQLGYGGLESIPLPKQTGGNPFKLDNITVGGMHACALVNPIFPN